MSDKIEKWEEELKYWYKKQGRIVAYYPEHHIHRLESLILKEKLKQILDKNK